MKVRQQRRRAVSMSGYARSTFTWSRSVQHRGTQEDLCPVPDQLCVCSGCMNIRSWVMGFAVLSGWPRRETRPWCRAGWRSCPPAASMRRATWTWPPRGGRASPCAYPDRRPGPARPRRVMERVGVGGPADADRARPGCS